MGNNRCLRTRANNLRSYKMSDAVIITALIVAGVVAIAMIGRGEE